ncbi:MAG: methionine synthase [Propionicimonas sp.]|uniref:methionine synthase n=1 Tax=Propionicimonas sp. TaxID=1955623 RepID=UPI003D145F1D
MVVFTGVGSLPGTDYGAALRMTFDRVPDLPYLPELPARGPWAAMVGRGLGLPSGLPAELAAGEWRLADAPGVDQRRARATWRDDLDRLEEAADGYAGRFKVGVTGPWTLAASLGVAHVGRVLADVGARRDLAQSVADGVGELLADLARRLPALELVLQVDEPSLPAVAAGAVPTPGGFFRHRAVDLPELCRGLAWVAGEPARRGLDVPTVLHCCAPWRTGPWPFGSLLGADSTGAGFGAISLDLDQLATGDWDPLAAATEAGATLHLGCLPTAGSPRPLGVDAVRRRALEAVDRLGGIASDALVLTPACGLAAWSAPEAGRAFDVLAKVAVQVAEELG